MAIPKFEDDVEVISKLPNYPGSEGGLTPEEFKAKFDIAAKLIKAYLNEVLIPEMDKTIDVDALINGILDSTLTDAGKAAQSKAVGTALATKLNLSGGKMTGAINMNSKAITYLPEPTATHNPATKNYVDTRKKTATCTLAKSTAWTDNSQTVTVSGVTASNTVIVAPQASYFNNYRNWGVRCTAQGENSLTFGCETTPTSALRVNVLIFE